MWSKGGNLAIIAKKNRLGVSLWLKLALYESTCEKVYRFRYADYLTQNRTSSVRFNKFVIEAGKNHGTLLWGFIAITRKIIRYV